jgi:hypothetical protein
MGDPANLARDEPKGICSDLLDFSSQYFGNRSWRGSSLNPVFGGKGLTISVLPDAGLIGSFNFFVRYSRHEFER